MYLDNLLNSSGVPKRILELGCGTGTTASFLSSRGYNVRATDLDTEMIRVAGDMSDTRGLEFAVEDMIETLEEAPSGRVGAVLCLGNTIPYLDSMDTVQRFFEEACRSMADGGQLAIQLLNYPKIIRIGKLSLPELQGEDLVFRRYQEYNTGLDRVLFRTEVEADGLIETRQHVMLPLKPDEMDAIAYNTGFRLQERISSWTGDEFMSDSPWFTVIYRKRQNTIGIV